MTKKVTTLFILLLLTILTVSCTSTNEPTVTEDDIYEDTSDITEVKIVAHQWMIKKYLLDDAVTNFEKNHPDIRVVLDVMDNKNSSILVDDFRKDQPTYDLAIGWDVSALRSYIEEDLLSPWENFFDESLAEEDMVGAFMDLGKLNGKQYVIPMTGEVLTVVIREDLFAEKGLLDEQGKPIPPSNWDEFLTYAQRLSLDEDGDGTPERYGACVMFTGNFLLQDYLYSLQAVQGTIYEEGTTKIDFTSQNAKDILSFWQEGVERKLLIEDTSTCRSAMKQGKLAIFVSTHSRWPETENELVVNGTITIMPLLSGDRGSFAFMHGLWLPKNSENRDIMYQFVKEEILQDDYFAWTLENYGKLSPLQSTYDALDDVRWKQLMEEANNAAIQPPYVDYSELSEAVNSFFVPIIAGDLGVEEGLQQLEEEIQDLDYTI